MKAGLNGHAEVCFIGSNERRRRLNAPFSFFRN